MKEIELKKNSVIWDGKKEGFYEAFYIQCNDPYSGMAWWFRYSIMIPKEGRGHPYAALWAVQYDQSGTRGPVAMKHIYPINHFRYEKDRFIIYIEDGFLTNSHATGKIKHDRRELEWDIQWVPSDETFIHYPESWYNRSLPKTKVVSPQWATTGGGFIRWNGEEFFINDALIHVGHVWGPSHSNNWVWVHSHGFDENKSAVFEGLWIPMCKSLGLSMCWFKQKDKVSRFMDIGLLWQTKDFIKTNEWKLKLNNSDYHIDGNITVDPAQIAGITYHDPDGSRRFCYNSKIATINMNVMDKKQNDLTILTSPNLSAFELCLSHEEKQFSILV